MIHYITKISDCKMTYTPDFRTKTLLCEKNFSCHFYSRETAKSDAVNMLADLLLKVASKENIIIDESEMLAKVHEIGQKAFFGDQIQEIQKNIKQLSA